MNKMFVSLLQALQTRFTTPIEVTEDTTVSPGDARHCVTTLTAQGSTLAKTLSTDETIDCEEVLKEAQAIRNRREANKQPEVVTSKCIYEMNSCLFTELSN